MGQTFPNLLVLRQTIEQHNKQITREQCQAFMNKFKGTGLKEGIVEDGRHIEHAF